MPHTIWAWFNPCSLRLSIHCNHHRSQGPGGAQGYAYVWNDTFQLQQGQTYFYWLEDIDLSGATNRNGPVSATFGATLMRKTFLPMLQVR